MTLLLLLFFFFNSECSLQKFCIPEIKGLYLKGVEGWCTQGKQVSRQTLDFCNCPLVHKGSYHYLEGGLHGALQSKSLILMEGPVGECCGANLSSLLQLHWSLDEINSLEKFVSF